MKFDTIHIVILFYFTDCFLALSVLAKSVLHLEFGYQLSYEEAEEKIGIQRPSVRLSKKRLRWTGHGRRCSRPRQIQASLLLHNQRGLVVSGCPDMGSTQNQFWLKLKERASDRLEWQNQWPNEENRCLTFYVIYYVTQ